ncbi:MAG: hypothetical protein GY765_22665 [bacterium]|nr:hypothetical protein [bacterium]
MELDYLLFDNQTESRAGRDWGLKIATGDLVEDKYIKETFYRYCRSIFEVSPGSLVGFSRAAGGFGGGSVSTSNWYVLCTAFEKPDRAGRDSLAVVGLYFPNSETLFEFLNNYDAVETAKAVFKNEDLPLKLKGMEIGTGRTGINNDIYLEYAKRKEQGGFLLKHFNPEESYEAVLALLSACYMKREPLPAILGVTSIFRTADYREFGFNIVFCRPGNETAKSALKSYIARQHDAPAKNKEQLPSHSPGKKGPYRKKDSQDFKEDKTDNEQGMSFREKIRKNIPGFISQFGAWLGNVDKTMLFSIIVILVVGTFLLVVIKSMMDEQDFENNGKEITSTEKTGSGTKDAGSGNSGETSQTVPKNGEEAMEYVKLLIQSLGALDPEALKSTEAYKIVTTVKVLNKYKKQRYRLKQILEEELPALKVHLIKQNLPYYFQDSVKEFAIAEKLTKIRELIREVKIDMKLFEPLEQAFGFEFESSEGILVRWRELLGAYEAFSK